MGRVRVITLLPRSSISFQIPFDLNLSRRRSRRIAYKCRDSFGYWSQNCVCCTNEWMSNSVKDVGRQLCPMCNERLANFRRVQEHIKIVSEITAIRDKLVNRNSFLIEEVRLLRLQVDVLSTVI